MSDARTNLRTGADGFLSARRQVWLVVSAFVFVVACVLYLTYTGLTIQGWLRAYAAGESLWSKSQKQAVIDLYRYAETGDERLYRAYRTALQVPLSDRRARLELEQRRPDMRVAYEGLAGGKNHPADIPGMTKLFRRFRTVSYVDSAIAIWAQGDLLIAELERLAEQLHTEVAVGAPDRERIAGLLNEIALVDAQLTPLEEAFTQTLSEGGRWLRRALFAVILIAAVLLVAGAASWAWVLVRRFERTEAAQRRSEEAYRSLVEGATHGILRTTPDGEIIAANPALVRLLRYESREAVAGLSLRDISTDREAFQRLVDGSRDMETIEGVEMEWRRRDGAQITVRLTGRPLHDDEAKRVLGFELFAEDVSVQRMLEERLRQSQKIQAVEQLSGGIAHDLNNLLTAILANADLLAASTAPLRLDAQENLDDLREAARRGASLIRKLLAFSRQERLALVPLRLDDAVRQQLDLLRRLLPDSIAVELDGDNDLPLVRADAAAIQQILVNLATNARDAMPQGGRIRLELSHVELDSRFQALDGASDAGTFVRLTFTDTGRGMTPEVQRRALEPFFTTKPAGAGAGLGLSMVYGLVKQHGGFIDVASEPQAGTSVTVFLPIADAKASVQTAEVVEMPFGSETILVVEDEAVIRRSARRVLERLGYRVLLATDGREGLEVFQQHAGEIDLAVLDVVMPGMTGPALLRELRRFRPDLKVLFMSGYVPRGSGPIVDSAEPFLRKPWSIHQLAATVREVLDARQRPEGDWAARGA